MSLFRRKLNIINSLRSKDDSHSLKEVFELMVAILTVFGALYLIFTTIIQYIYSCEAEDIYKIRKEFFYSKNLLSVQMTSLFVLSIYMAIVIVGIVLILKMKRTIGFYILSFIYVSLAMYICTITIIVRHAQFFSNNITLWGIFIIDIIIFPVVAIYLLIRFEEVQIRHLLFLGVMICMIVYSFSILFPSTFQKESYKHKKEYEIAENIEPSKDWLKNNKKINTTLVNVVVLHSGSQVLLMKGYMQNENELIIYTGVYSFQDIDKYSYKKIKFTKISTSELSQSIVY